MAAKNMTYSIDIDIGGTFTDGFFTDGEQVRTEKVLTTPHDITEGFMNCVEAGSQAFGLDLGDFLRRSSVARVSTTVGTNLIVQRAGPRLGLIVTKGQENGLYGRGKAAALDQYIPANMVAGVREATDDKGKLTTEVDRDEVLEVVRDLIQAGARMIVISFKNAWRNGHNEQRVRDIIRDRYPVHYLRSVPLQVGTEVIHVADDHARTNSVLFNAYVHGEMARTLYRADDKLRAAGYGRPLLVVHASGGNARVAKTIALHTMHSGPAVAARGAAVIAKLLGLKRVVTTDMGGTSLDVSLISDGTASFNLTPQIDGIRIATPMIEVESVGAGGGSIATVEDGNLRVGPESAGAEPGPVCYAKGGMNPTVTDANLLLGFIDPSYFLGGRMELDVDTARRAMERQVGRALKTSGEDGAFAVRDTINREMAYEIGRRLRARGGKAKDYTLFSFGGCGPLHGCAVADLAGIERIVAFPYGSVFSAFGSSTTSVQHTYSKTLGIPVRQISEAETSLATFRAQAETDMIGEGFTAKDIRMRLEIETSKGGKTRTISAAGKRGTVKAALRNAGGVIEAIRLTAECDVAKWSPQKLAGSARRRPSQKGTRDVFWQRGRPEKTPIYDRFAFTAGHSIAGPAIVEGPDTSYAVEPGWQLEVDSYGNFVMTRVAS